MKSHLSIVLDAEQAIAELLAPDFERCSPMNKVVFLDWARAILKGEKEIPEHMPEADFRAIANIKNTIRQY